MSLNQKIVQVQLGCIRYLLKKYKYHSCAIYGAEAILKNLWRDGNFKMQVADKKFANQ